ncbi:MAG: SCO family protein [Desulfobulbaceae bacterium]|nr:MAG: SCO family protein [Desulfobulbaceae bacterium]
MMAAGVTSGQESSTETSVEGGKIWVDEQTGSILPLDLVFSNEQGEPVTLGSLFDKPIILLPIYFYCPNSCSTNLANLAGAMNRMKLEAGKDYRAIALSFNEKDSAKDAQDAKNNYLPLLYKGFPGEQWNFLTGSHQNISQLLDVIGYNFKPLDDGTFIHPSALITASEDGMVIKYVYGNFIPGDVEMAVSEAQKGTPALSVKRLLNFCFNYDPDANKSYFQTVKVVVLLVFSLSVFVFFLLFIRKKKSDRSS